MHHRSQSLPRLLLVGITVLGASRSGAAQAPAPPANHKTNKTWHAVGTLRVEEQSNNNVFLLSDVMRARLDMAARRQPLEPGRGALALATFLAAQPLRG